MEVGLTNDGGGPAKYPHPLSPVLTVFRSNDSMGTWGRVGWWRHDVFDTACAPHASALGGTKIGRVDYCFDSWHQLGKCPFPYCVLTVKDP